MAMPNNLVLVRHGQSEANILVEASKTGDDSLYTDDMVNYPDRSWRLTHKGVQQAQTSGAWITQNIIKELGAFDRFITSPYTRTRETAGTLSIDDAIWEENRVIRERSWGEIDSMPRSEFIERYPANAQYKKKDPIYWSPPAGESLANVAENRVRNILSTLHRENSGDNVLMVTHGEFIWATRMVLERWSDEQFLEFDEEPNMKIHNCHVVHYTRINPATQEIAPKLKWVRTAYPYFVDGKWDVIVSDWKTFDKVYLSNEDLIAKAELQAHRLEKEGL